MPLADPVASKRARIARTVVSAKRVGYGLYLLGMVVFGIGYAAGYTELLTTTIMICLVVGSFVLAPAIVFGYGVKAAEREERRAAQADALRRATRTAAAPARDAAPAREPTAG